MRASDTIGELATALAKVQGIMRPLSKNREVSVKMKSGGTYKFSYTTFDAIIEAVRDPLSDNGLAFAQGVGYDGVGSVLTTRLMHASGQWIESDTPIQVTENSAQAFGSGITYAKRYALSSMLGIATDFDDDGGASSGHESESRDRHQRTPPPKPGPRSVERGTPLAEAHREITQGTASTASQGKPAGEPMGPKEWANSIEAHHWIQGEAVTQINAIGNPKSLGEWQSVNRESLQALELHCTKRHGWLMNKINERLDYLTNLRGAA